MPIIVILLQVMYSRCNLCNLHVIWVRT